MSSGESSEDRGLKVIETWRGRTRLAHGMGRYLKQRLIFCHEVGHLGTAPKPLARAAVLRSGPVPLEIWNSP